MAWWVYGWNSAWVYNRVYSYQTNANSDTNS